MVVAWGILLAAVVAGLWSGLRHHAGFRIALGLFFWLVPGVVAFAMVFPTSEEMAEGDGWLAWGPLVSTLGGLAVAAIAAALMSIGAGLTFVLGAVIGHFIARRSAT